MADAAKARGASTSAAKQGAGRAAVQAAAAVSSQQLICTGKRHRNPNWKDAIRQEDAPMLWQAVSGANSVARALNILRSASAEDIEEARTTGTLGLITPVVRAAAAKGRSGEAELLKFLEMP